MSNGKFIWVRGKSSSYRKGGNDYWEGAGWTGQPLLTRENDTLYLYQGSLDYNLKKINATDGRILWQYKFDDVIKGTGSLSSLESVGDVNMKHVIIQGSRRGYGTSLGSKNAFSLRAISALTGKEIWRYNVPQTHSVSRDVDGSPLILRDTLYAGLENGILSVLNPIKTTEDKKWHEPEVIDEFKLFGATKGKTNIVIESSPVLLGNRIFLATGAGYVYGMNLKSKRN
ncbi:MAG: PQQ-binding-like beta-propeller repeat protein [Ignavibacteria bacterium]|nr:PQQ-binding-like beta-propeller repeat protein [Ignavibacteria bacterium]